MGAFGGYVFSRRSDLDELLGELDQYLSDFSQTLQRTRKGRVWRLWTKDGRPFDVDVRATRDALEEVEEDLLDAELLPETAPYTIGISSGLGEDRDRELILEIAGSLARIADGVLSLIER